MISVNNFWNIKSIQFKLDLNMVDFIFLMEAYKNIHLLDLSNEKIFEYYPSESISQFAQSCTTIIKKQKNWYKLNAKGISKMQSFKTNFHITDKSKMVELISALTEDYIH